MRYLATLTFAVAAYVCSAGAFQNALDKDAARDGAETITLKNFDAMQKRRTTQAHIRQFLWDHFQNRRTGNIRVVQFTKEGEKTITEYHIQPDPNGEWFVKADVERHLIDRHTHRRHIVTQHYVAQKLGLEPIKSQFSSQELGRFMTHRLTMMNRDGQVVSWF